ncbi:MAG: HNH endonuclease [Prevotella sp.]|nr:HNH endonuclease [Prevotella sp.]
MKFTQGDIAAMIIDGNLAAFYNSREWRKLSKAVIKDGNYECIECRRKGKVTQAVLTHHVNELKTRPDLAYSLTYTDENGETRPQLIPLCHDCHEKIHERGIYSEDKKKDDVHFWQEEKW